MDWFQNDAEGGAGSTVPSGGTSNNLQNGIAFGEDDNDDSSTISVEKFWPEEIPSSKQDKRESTVYCGGLWKGWGYLVGGLLFLMAAWVGALVYLRTSNSNDTTEIPPPTHQWILQYAITNVTNMNVDVFEPSMTLSSDAQTLFYVVSDGVNQAVHLYRYSTVDDEYRQLKHLELSANYSLAFAPNARGLAIGTRQNMTIYTIDNADDWGDNTAIVQNNILLPQSHDQHTIREILLRDDVCAVSGIDNIHVDSLRNSIFVTPLVFRQDDETMNWDPVLQPNWTEPLPSVGKPTTHLALAQNGATIAQCIRHRDTVQVLMRDIAIPEGGWMSARAVSCDAASRIVWMLSEDSLVLVVGCETNNFLETWTRPSSSSTTWYARDNISLGIDVIKITDIALAGDGSITVVLVQTTLGVRQVLSFKRNTHGSHKHADWVPLAAPLQSMGGLALNSDGEKLSTTVLLDDSVQPAVYQLYPL